jgi:NAD-dependent dihydropyrimidine dehydrogenase PreA subunit
MAGWPGQRSEGKKALTYVIGEPCIDVMDRACVEECPVDCIYEGERSLYIHPDECVDCGACEPVCPVEAIYYEDDLPSDLEPYKDDNARFFAEPLPGRDRPLSSPGGAGKLGVVGVDTELVASYPKRETAS